MSFGNTGDQVGSPSESQRGRKASDYRDDLPFQPEPIQGFINRSSVDSPPRDADVGAVFALASATIDITTARPEAVATGMRASFAVAAILIVIALAIAVGSRALATRSSLPGDVS